MGRERIEDRSQMHTGQSYSENRKGREVNAS